MFCLWSSLKVSRRFPVEVIFKQIWKYLEDPFRLVFEVVCKNLLDYLFGFWSGLNLGDPYVWSSVKEFRGLPVGIVFIEIWKNLEDSLSFIFEVVCKNLGDSLSGFWNDLKESWGSLCFVFEVV